MSLLFALIGTLAFAIAAPVLGCLLAGLDRKITARMQGRVLRDDAAIRNAQRAKEEAARRG